MKSNYFFRAVSLLVLLVSLVPASNAGALPLADPPPANMFQLPWDLGIAWVAIDGLDNGTRRPLNSSHHYTVGGAIDFAPHNNMKIGENTSNFWVAAAASGTVTAKSFCHVKIDHGNGWTTEYQFLANVQVKVGDSVSRNQRLGIIADGFRQPFCPGSQEPNVPHVHFMLRPTLRDAKLAGWEVNYLPILNKTTFRKNNQTVGLFQPLLNTFDEIQIVLRGPITWDVLYSGTVDAFRYERWSLTLDELNKFTLTATPTTSGLVPLIVLMDSNANEIARSPGTLTSTQPAGSYFVQIQPQTGSGPYTLLLQRNDLPSGPFVSTTVTPASVNVGQTTTATVRLNNVPTTGYTSTEFTCTYNSTLAQVSNIAVANLFGADPVVAINDPQNGSFIVAVAGSQGSKATTDGTAFTFSLTGLQVGQTAVECKARVSTGDNVLTAIDFIPGSLTITGNTPTQTPGPIPTTPIESPVPTAMQTQSPSPNTPTPTHTPSGPTHSPTPSITPGGATATPIPNTVYDFAANMCAATWSSGAGQLPCPGTDGDPDGFVLKLNQPQLESGAIDPRPALLTVPQNTQNGYIQGLFPPFHVENGDRFRATLSCQSGATACYVAFRLDYQVGTEPIKTFWGPFLERYEGQTFSVDVSLSPLAGKDVKFILTVLAAGQASGDRALWVGPIITRASSASTSTPPTGETSTPTPYVSPTSTTTGPVCNKAELVADVTLPPGSAVLPGSMPTKIWRVKNVGTCAWTNGYGWKFVGGELMDAPLSNTFAYSILPGETFDIYVSFFTPLAAGHYQSSWKLFNASGVEFGVGDSGNDPLVLDIIASGPTVTASVTLAPTNPAEGWNIFTNNTYGFRFSYPLGGEIIPGGTDNSTRINLPKVPGTNLTEKYLQMTVIENVDPCRSPLATSSIPQTSETVVINGITFLKETGEDGTAGHINTWIAYSTLRNNACISLDFVLRAANPGVFATPPVLYDKEAESVVFGQIVSTFQWLDGPGTSTPTPAESATPTATQSTPAVSPTPTALSDGTITGQVLASKPVTVSLYDATDTLVTSVTANPDGSFSLTAPAGTYTIIASASGFLTAEGSATITGGSTSTKPTLTLLAGDLDGNDVIDQFDALTIGMSYNTATPAEADLNNDGVINVLDLELLAGNYRKSAPQAWE